MRLINLNPEYALVKGIRTAIVFDCPHCFCEEKCRIVVPFAGEGVKWKKEGDEFRSMSLFPSIWFNRDKKNPVSCEAHFFIVRGEIDFV